MDTLINISPVESKFRSLLIVAGVAIAIICSIVSLKAINTPEDSRDLGSLEKPAFVSADLAMKAVSTLGHSVIIITNE